mmetsp:Transcript_21349/g.73910  ORF Transcript_21349/g.73910 Transcript_21349/m.73910 type:complete len:332 (+) Transcript_21349:250-1245(+)
MRVCNCRAREEVKMTRVRCAFLTLNCNSAALAKSEFKTAPLSWCSSSSKRLRASSASSRVQTSSASQPAGVKWSKEESSPNNQRCCAKALGCSGVARSSPLTTTAATGYLSRSSAPSSSSPPPSTLCRRGICAAAAICCADGERPTEIKEYEPLLTTFRNTSSRASVGRASSSRSSRASAGGLFEAKCAETAPSTSPPSSISRSKATADKSSPRRNRSSSIIAVESETCGATPMPRGASSVLRRRSSVASSLKAIASSGPASTTSSSANAGGADLKNGPKSSSSTTPAAIDAKIKTSTGSRRRFRVFRVLEVSSKASAAACEDARGLASLA